MDKKELNEIVSLKDIDTITIALQNRGWSLAENHPIAGELSLVDLFNAKEIVTSKYHRDKTYGYEADIRDNVPNGEKWLWLVVYADERVSHHWKPRAIRTFIKEK